MQPITSVSRRDAVVQEIRRSIVTGSIRPGDRLTEVGLATALDVSRPTVREALSLLAADGMLDQKPYRGLRVTQLSTKTIRDLAHVRMALDLEAVRLIWADDSGQRRANLEAAWDAYQRSAVSKDPIVRYDGHIALHKGIWAAADNEMLMRMWPMVLGHLTILLAQDQVNRADPAQDLWLHTQLMDAIRSGELARVTAALDLHTLQSAELLISALEEQGDTTPGRKKGAKAQSSAR